MSFGERIKYRRGELKLSRADLAERLGVSSSAVSNYENGVSFPKEDIMLRLFDSLETEPNILFQDSYRGGGQVMSGPEQALLWQYRGLSPMGRESVRSVVEALCSYRDELEAAQPEQREPRVIPLYRTPAAAGYASPVFGEDFDYISVTDEVPQAAEFYKRMGGERMRAAKPTNRETLTRFIYARKIKRYRTGNVRYRLKQNVTNAGIAVISTS